MNYNSIFEGLLTEAPLKDQIPDFMKDVVRPTWGKEYLDYEVPEHTAINELLPDGKYPVSEELKRKTLDDLFNIYDGKLSISTFRESIEDNAKFLDWFEKSLIDQDKKIDIMDPWYTDIKRLATNCLYNISVKKTKETGDLHSSKNQQVDFSRWLDSYNRASNQSKHVSNFMEEFSVKRLISRMADKSQFDIDLFAPDGKMFLYISSKPEDILRMSLSNFYDSCQNLYTGSERDALLANVFDPAMKVVYLIFDVEYIDKSNHKHPFCAIARSIARNVDDELFIDTTYPSNLTQILYKALKDNEIKCNSTTYGEYYKLNRSYMGNLEDPYLRDSFGEDNDEEYDSYGNYNEQEQYRRTWDDGIPHTKMSIHQYVDYLINRPFVISDNIETFPKELQKMIIERAPRKIAAYISNASDEIKEKIIEINPMSLLNMNTASDALVLKAVEQFEKSLSEKSLSEKSLYGFIEECLKMFSKTMTREMCDKFIRTLIESGEYGMVPFNHKTAKIDLEAVKFNVANIPYISEITPEIIQYVAINHSANLEYIFNRYTTEQERNEWYKIAAEANPDSLKNISVRVTGVPFTIQQERIDLFIKCGNNGAKLMSSDTTEEEALQCIRDPNIGHLIEYYDINGKFFHNIEFQKFYLAKFPSGIGRIKNLTVEACLYAINSGSYINIPNAMLEKEPAIQMAMLGKFGVHFLRDINLNNISKDVLKKALSMDNDFIWYVRNDKELVNYYLDTVPYKKQIIRQLPEWAQTIAILRHPDILENMYGLLSTALKEAIKINPLVFGAIPIGYQNMYTNFYNEVVSNKENQIKNKTEEKPPVV